MSKRRKPAGFTLIELLVVASLTVIIMLSVVSMLMTFLLASQKATAKQKVKSEGERALAQIEFILRNSQKLVPGLDAGVTCNNDAVNPMTNLGIEGLDGYTTILQAYPTGTPKIASHSSAVNDYYYLTNETTLSNLEFTCLTGAEEDVFYVNVSFDLKIGPGSEPGPDTAMETFQTGITLRNK